MPNTSLYIHIPWCIRKCPYCDFNSHKSPDNLPEMRYVQALVADLTADLTYLPTREISSIFIGGGTPSLFSAAAYEYLLQQLQQLVKFAQNIEITLEANPGSVEQQRFSDYRTLGINRLSLGIQSFNPIHLKILGRIHNDHDAHKAIETARRAGFDNINIDIMHSLPNQTVAQGLADLTCAIAYHPEHFSWYQLTIEPNTLFYKQRPTLPNEDTIEALDEAGFALLTTKGFKRYEISAFSQAPYFASHHNMNYWLFGDYYGIGAGAHGKLTLDNYRVCRTRKQRQPHDYLNPDKTFLAAQEFITKDALIFEFMLNATRLQQPIANALFSTQTGLSFDILSPLLEKANDQGLIHLTASHWQVTTKGRRYTNNLQALFL
jgi:putative oxygen-independent coproporphyrinogen III oxidase